MEKGRALFRVNVILAAVATIMLSMNHPAVWGEDGPEEKSPEVRADIIDIDSMRLFGTLEKPPVAFLHQKHTEALDKQNKSCDTCHPTVKDPLLDSDRMSLLFMRLENTTRQKVMDIYHENCIGCHKQTKTAQDKSGPLECGGCHLEEVRLLSSWHPIGLDKSLHYRHVKAQENKCENCHHKYNENTKELIPTKGEDGTCRYCHGEKTQDNRISMRLASHIACIGCHRRTIAKNESAGPVNCNGCHAPEEQKLIEKIKDVPRMKLDQPDVLLVETHSNREGDSAPLIRMDRVPFDHRAHETSNDTCRVCHHAALNDCVGCHSIRGMKEGNYVTLEQSMHRLKVNQSCLGCHEAKQSDPICAGCHTSFEKKRPQGTAGCINCHLVPKTLVAPETPPAEIKILAAAKLANREAVVTTYNREDIPEIVTIDTLTDEYKPVKLPHAKIINALFNNIKKNKLTQYFHDRKGTICQGCHHNSPVAQKPPSCASCHGRPFNPKEPFKPGLKAAYHRQCMECHRAMGIDTPVATDCTACHAKKWK